MLQNIHSGVHFHTQNERTNMLQQKTKQKSFLFCKVKHLRLVLNVMINVN